MAQIGALAKQTPDGHKRSAIEIIGKNEQNCSRLQINKEGNGAMEKLPLTSLSTLVAWAVFFWTLFLVGRGRAKYGVAAPAVSGNEMFERCFRIQMNTLEQLLMLLPVLWLCAFWVGDGIAAIGGLVWSAGRILYGVTYLSDPAKRGPGFILTFTPTCVMVILTAVQIIRRLI